MTYLQFHLVFILPPILVLLIAIRGARAALGPRTVWVLPVIALIAMVYTTAWDNYLVYRGVWWYGADRVIGTIGWVPVEEYLFFILQPVLTGAWTYLVLMRRPLRIDPSPVRQVGGLLQQLGDRRLVGAAIYALATGAGLFALTVERGLYLGLILVWAAPVLAAQWPFIASGVASAPGRFAVAAGVPTLYLWVADRVAIGAGIWSISPRYTTGVHIAGLPMEEAVFFLVTNLLVVQGVLLFLQPSLEREAPAPADPPHTAHAGSIAVQRAPCRPSRPPFTPDRPPFTPDRPGVPNGSRNGRQRT
ncbi:MAG: lycopene cyclase domain-containing protein [Gemmatimonadetes bacterium]|nr:lycopene cyclase domain-containing protein [Gemmatimonadota bacterium]